MPLDFSRPQAARNNSLGLSTHDHQIEHLGLWKHADRARSDLAAKRLIAAEQKLLASLAARIKCAGHLRAAKRTVCQQPSVLAGERYALRDALVDNVVGDFSEAINVRFARPKIAAFYRVME